MKARKLLNTIIAMMLVLSMVVGCGNGNSDSAKDETIDSAPVEETKENDEKNDDTMMSDSSVSEKGVLPIVEEKITLDVIVPQSPRVSDYEVNLMTEYLEEQTNIHINWQVIPAQDINQKINLMIASGQDLPDIFLTSLSTDLLNAYSDKDTFLGLNDLISSQGYYMKEAMDKNPSKVESLKLPDGEIYGLPRHYATSEQSSHSDVSGKMWINQRWLDNLGLDMPTTTDEFMNVLKAFKNDDPNGNGVNDEIPLVGAASGGWDSLPEIYLLNSFVQYDPANMLFRDNNGAVKASYVDDGYRDGISYMNDLFEAGLLDPVTYTQDNAQLKQLVEAPEALVGAFPSGVSLMCLTPETERFDDYVAMAPLVGPDGIQLTKTRVYTLRDRGFTAISATCEHPEAAFKWLDYFFSDDVTLRNKWGIEGEHWEKASEGDLGIDGQPALITELVSLSGGAQHNVTHATNFGNTPKYINRRTVEDSSNYESILFNVSKELYWPYIPKEENYVKRYFYTEADSEIINLNSTIKPFVDEKLTKFILGIDDINDEEIWGSYKEELEKMGYEDVLEVVQRRIDNN